MTDNTSTYGLTSNTVQQIQQVFSEFPQVTSAILYGSRAKGNYRPGSDIDLTLKTKGEGSLHLLTGIMDALDDLDLVYGFDISLLADINNESLIDHIERVGIEFYHSEACAV
jgi:predicted nucleotidyltransferase